MLLKLKYAFSSILHDLDILFYYTWTKSLLVQGDFPFFKSPDWTIGKTKKKNICIQWHATLVAGKKTIHEHGKQMYYLIDKCLMTSWTLGILN